jgi:hypothetical protein
MNKFNILTPDDISFIANALDCEPPNRCDDTNEQLLSSTLIHPNKLNPKEIEQFRLFGLG